MNEVEPKTSPTGAPEQSNLQQQVAALQRQNSTLLTALCVLSVTVCFYLWRQARYVSTDLQTTKTSVAPLLETFNRDKPRMDKFVADLTAFGRTNPDFMPILNKYQIPIASNAPTTATPASTPKSPPSAQPKK